MFSARQSTQFQSGVGGRGGGRGSGAVGGFLGESETGGAAISFSPQAVQNARQAGITAAASAQDLGDLFEYRLTQPVTIRTNQSAMVPILNTKVNAERVSIWNRTPGSGRPLRAVWLTNTSGLTLDGGSLSVIDANAFAGEGLVDPLKPSEKRLVSYGSDLGVLVDSRMDESSGRYTRVVARDGVVIADAGEPQRVGLSRSATKTRRRARWSSNIPCDRVDADARDPAAGRDDHDVGAPFPCARGGPRRSHADALTERRPASTRTHIEQIDDRLIASFGQRGVSVEELRRFLQPVIDARRGSPPPNARSRSDAQVTTIANDQ